MILGMLVGILRWVVLIDKIVWFFLGAGGEEDKEGRG